jgi:outer membrane protein assembly factor BamB
VRGIRLFLFARPFVRTFARTSARMISVFTAAALIVPGIWALSPGRAMAAGPGRLAGAGAAAPLPAAPGGSQDDWPELHRSPQLHGYAPNSPLSTANASGLGVAWATNLYGAVLDSPVVAYDSALNETLAYAGTERGDVIAVNLSNGRIVWSDWLGGPVRSTPVVSGGFVYAAVFNSPRVYKLDAATGKVGCSLAAPHIVESSLLVASPPGGARTLYIGTIDSGSASGPLLAVNAGTCAVEWSFTAYHSTAGEWDPLAYAVDGKNVPLILFGTSDPDSRVYAVNAVTGKRVWEFATDNPSPFTFDIGAGVTVVQPGSGDPDGVAYVPTKHGDMYALDLTTGAKRGSYDFGAALGLKDEGLSTAALDGRNLVFGVANGLVDLDPAVLTGQAGTIQHWHYTDPATKDVLSSPAIAGPPGQEVVSAADLAGGFEVVSLAAGSQLFHYQTAGYITASPAVSGGNIIAGSSDGFLYDFAVGGGNDATPPATTITSPAGTAPVANPNGNLTVTGSASDAGGTGHIAAVRVAVQKGGPAGPWWDAAAKTWNPGPVANAATLGTAPKWSFSYPVPAGGETYRVIAYAVSSGGQSDTKGATTRFSVLASTTGPHLSVTPGFVPPGGHATVSGGGFGGSEKIAISLAGTTLATATSTTKGGIGATKITVPASEDFGLASLTAAGQSSHRSASTAITVANGWDQIGYGATHTGFEPNDNVLKTQITPGGGIFLDPAWQYQAAGPVNAAPAIVHNVAYIADASGQLAAVDVGNGAPLWARTLTAGAAIDGAPAVDPATTLVFAGGDDGNLYARHTGAGDAAWTASVGGNLTAPVYGGGEVYVASSTGTVAALSEATGAVTWLVRLPSPITAAPTLDQAAGILTVGESNGALVALAATSGSTRWTFTTRGALASAAAINGGIVYFGSADHSVYALKEQNGSKIWAFATGGAVAATPALESNETPGGALELVAGSNDGTVYFLRASDGKLFFTEPMGSPVAGIATVNGIEIADSSTGQLRGARTHTTIPVWSYRTHAPITAPPAITDGTVYIATAGGTVSAFTAFGQLPDRGPARIRPARMR